MKMKCCSGCSEINWCGSVKWTNYIGARIMTSPAYYPPSTIGKSDFDGVGINNINNVEIGTVFGLNAGAFVQPTITGGAETLGPFDYTFTNVPPGVVNPLGSEYSLVDPQADNTDTEGPLQYRLIELEAQGTRRSYGPYDLELKY